MGLSCIPTDNPRFLGMVGMHGTKTSNYGVSQCDLLVVVGARFSDRVISNKNKFAVNAKVIHIDIDPAEINKNIMTSASIVGDLKEVLTKLNEKIENCDLVLQYKAIAYFKLGYIYYNKQERS